MGGRGGWKENEEKEGKGNIENVWAERFMPCLVNTAQVTSFCITKSSTKIHQHTE